MSKRENAQRHEPPYPTPCDHAMAALLAVHRAQRALAVVVPTLRTPALRPALMQLETAATALLEVVRGIEQGVPRA